MPLNCRLCGHEKPANELVISLESESDKVTFRDLVEYFMRITLERDASLTQKVCKTCKVSLESFMYFCDHVEKHQKELKKTLLKSKEMVMVSIPKPEIVIETELPDPCSDSGGIDDIGEDSNMSTELTNGYAESTTSRSSNHNLRKRSLSAVPVDLKDCSVVLDRLDIGYVTSDTESEEEVPIEDKITPRKRPFSDGESPPIAKRMRVSPIKSPLKRETPTRPVIQQEAFSSFSIPSKPISSGNNFKAYLKFYEAEFSCNYKHSKYNLPGPLIVKNNDGSLKPIKKLVAWSSIEQNCMYCHENFKLPYELQAHKNTKHIDENEKFFFHCSLCISTIESYDLYSYIKHISDSHHKHLKYCCVCCSKMYYNYTALFHHYGSMHREFYGVYMCLYDGNLYESFETWQSHSAKHLNTNQ